MFRNLLSDGSFHFLKVEYKG